MVMSIAQEIVKAIGAHAKWKLRLRHVIDSGTAEIDMADIGREDRCPFGQWMFGPTVSEETRESANFLVARELHAKFHNAAARIVELVSEGKRADADRLLNGEYSQLSTELTALLVNWRRRVEGNNANGKPPPNNRD